MRAQNILTACLIGIIPFALFSCTKTRNQDPTTLKIALSSAPPTLDPRKATDATGMRLINLMYQSLVRVNEKLEVESDAAQTWSYKNHVYEFVLKPNLKFHDGRAVTKEDVLYSIEQFRATTCPFSSAFNGIESVSATDVNGTLHVQIKVRSYSAKFLSSDLPVIKIMPNGGPGETPMGSGPLKFISKGLSQIDLERAEPDPVKFNKFQFKVIKDDFTRSQKLIKGEIDVAISELPPDLVMKLKTKNENTLQVFTYPGLSMTYLLVNLKDKELQKKAVRQALSQALRRDEIIKYKLMDLAQEATSILTPNNPYFNSDLKNPPHDLERAKAVLTAVKTLSLKTSSNPIAVDHGKVIANQLEKTGVAIKLESFEWGTFYSDIKNGNFQLATMKWVGAFDPDVYRIAFHSTELPPGRNRGAYINKELDPLLDQAHQLEDFERRKQMYARIQKTIHDDVAIIPLWYETQTAVLRRSIEGFQPSPLSDYTGLLNVHRQEIP